MLHNIQKLFKRSQETEAQFTMESFPEVIQNRYKRAKGKIYKFLKFRYKWHFYPDAKKIPKFPLNIFMEASSACELKCDHCFRQYMDMRENDFMPFNMWKKIVDECSQYEDLFTIKFSMRGEPTSDPDLPNKIKYGKEKGIPEIWINTHGGNLTEEYTRKLLEAGPDWITVSLDGLDEMYESIRKPQKWDDVFEKVKRLKKLRDEISPDTLLNTQGLWSAIKHNPKEYYNRLRPYFDRIVYNPDMNFKEITLVPDPNYVCPRLWQSLAITSKGDVLKCPSDFEKDEVIGNVMKSSIKNIWDVQQEKERQRHLAGKKNESVACKKCHHGAIKVPKNIKVKDNIEFEAKNYVYKDGFKGVGLNREK